MTQQDTDQTGRVGGVANLLVDLLYLFAFAFILPAAYGVWVLVAMWNGQIPPTDPGLGDFPTWLSATALWIIASLLMVGVAQLVLIRQSLAK